MTAALLEMLNGVRLSWYDVTYLEAQPTAKYGIHVSPVQVTCNGQKGLKVWKTVWFTPVQEKHVILFWL